MKVRVGYKRKRGVTYLCVDGDKGDELSYAEAETIRCGRFASFVPLVYERYGASYQLNYYAQGLVPLAEVVRSPFVPGQLAMMLTSFLALLCDCESGGLSRQRVSMDPEHILMNPDDGRLGFVYVPFQSYASTASGVSGALAYLCMYAWLPSNETYLRDVVLDYARRTALITSVSFSGLLAELGVIPKEAALRGVAQPQNWLDTDQLGERAAHGHDFVRAQREEQAAREQAARVQQAAARAQATAQAAAAVPSQTAPAGEVPATTWLLTRLTTGAAWQLGEGTYELGRDASCSIALDDVRGLSRHHARIEVTASGCFVTDLNSTNGTSASGAPLPPGTPVAIGPGTMLELGDETFEVRALS